MYSDKEAGIAADAGEKVPAKQLERMMLRDAIEWQSGVVDSQRGCDGYDENLSLLKQYRALYRRRYGAERTVFDHLVSNAEVVTLQELRDEHKP